MPEDSLRYDWNDSWAEMIHSDASRSGWTHSGVAIRTNGEIITSDNGESKIITYSPEGKIIKSWKADFTHAHGITLSHDEVVGEIIWIADNGSRKEKNIGYEYPDGSHSKSGRVFKSTLSGNEISELPFPIHEDYQNNRYAPTSIAVNEKSFGGNGDIWVADGYGANLVHRYDENSNYVQTIDGTSGAGRFKCPHGILIDYRSSTPELYIADRVNKRVQVYNLEGKYLRSFGEDFLSTPSGFAILDENTIIAELKGRLTVVDAQDNLIGYLFPDKGDLNRPGWPNAIGKDGVIVQYESLLKNVFNSPHDIVTDKIGNVYVTEWLIGGRITKLSRKIP